MEKLQITKGEYKSEIADDDTFAQVSHRDYTVLTVQGTHNHNDEKEHNDITLLCADALNTYQQCETLPSELLRQNRETKEALQIALTEIRSMKLFLMAHPDHTKDSEFWDRTDGAEEVEKVIIDCLTSCNKGKE